MTSDADRSDSPVASSTPPGLTTFTIEGRRAPALFVVGWLASLLGLGLAIVGLLRGGGLTGAVLFTVGLAVLGLGLIAAAGSQAIERRATAHRPYAGPSPVLVFAAVLPLTLVVVIAVGTPLVGLGVDANGPLAAVISLAAIAAVYVVLIRLLVVGTGALGWGAMGVRRPGRGVVEDLAWGAVLGVPVLFATGLLASLLARFLPIPPNVLPPAPDTAGLILNLLAAALIAPIGEEVFFRGFVTTAWARTDGPRVALVRGSLFFAIAHVLTLTGGDAGQALGFAVFAFLARLPVAFTLGWLFLRRGSLYAPIALHVVFNGLQVLALAAAGGVTG